MANLTLNVVNSNDLSILSQICANRIKCKQEGENPFLRDKIIVMNKGMQMYLQQEIAHNNLICSGVDFSPLWAFIWELHKGISGADEYNRFDHEHMVWSLFSMIDKWKDENDVIFKAMQDYLKVDEGEDEGAKAYQLCGAIADCFDQYQMYRPEWIEFWNTLTLEDFKAVDLDANKELILKGGALSKFVDDVLKNSKGNKESAKKTLINNIWQIKLWVMLRGNLNPTENEYSSYDRPSVIKELIDTLSTPSKADLIKNKLPRRLFIFGVTSMPTQVIDLFCAIGKHIEVLYMHLNPCQEYWGDLLNTKQGWQAQKNIIVKYLKADKLEQRQYFKNNKKSFAEEDVTEDYIKEFDKLFDENNELVDGNSLLISLGKECKDTFNELLKRDTEVDFTNVFCESVDPDVNGSDTLLNRIKDQLLTLNTKEKFRISDTDTSVEFHSCHTPLREVEVLRDRMLEIFKRESKKQKASTKNFMVMVPNIEKYSPFIETVFGSIDKDDPNYIPYAVCDRTAKSDNKIASAIIELLSIGSRRITSSLIVDLLSIESIAKKISISSDEVSVIAGYLKKANIHWGLDDEDVKEEISKDIYLPWTVSRGLDRIIDGFFKGSDIVGSACSDVDTSDFELINKLCAFVNKLKQIRDEFSPNLDLTNDAWTQKLQDILLTGLFSDDDNNEVAFINKILVQMNESICNLKAGIGSGEDTGVRSSLKIKLPVFKAKLEHAFGNDRDSSKYLRGKVNFCSFIPMRAVPFDYIFLLGMNDGDFPRKEVLPNFNLMGVKEFVRNNDRIKTVDDRFLFLEAILSAKKSLYISYIGQSPIDKSELNPSPVVIELLDHIAEHFYVGDEPSDEDDNIKLIKQRLLRQETLNSYDRRNYLEDKNSNSLKTVSYNTAAFWNESTEDKAKLPLGFIKDENISSIKIKNNEKKSVSLSDLLNVFKNPSKAYLQNSLNIKYVDSIQGIVSEDEEPVDISKFDKNNLVSDLFKDFMSYYFSQKEPTTNIILDRHSTIRDPEFNKNQIKDLKAAEFVATFLEIKKNQGSMPYSIFFEKEKKDIIKLFETLIAAFFLEHVKDDFAQMTYSKSDFTVTSDFHEKPVNISISGVIPKYSNYLIDLYHENLTSQGIYTNLLKALFTVISYYLAASDRMQEVKLISIEGERYRLENIPTKEDSLYYLKELLYYYELMQYIPVPITKKFMDECLNGVENDKTPEDIFDTKDDYFDYETEAVYLFRSVSDLKNISKKQKEIALGFANTVCEIYKNMKFVKEEF